MNVVHNQVILDYIWDNFYGPRVNRVFNWKNNPLVVTGFEMGFENADHERVTIRNWDTRPVAGPDAWAEGTYSLNSDGIAMIKPRWDERNLELSQHRTNWEDWKRQIVLSPCNDVGTYY